MPEWQQRPRVLRKEMALEVERGPAWVFEGGFSTTYDHRATRADTLIWLDLPVGLRLWRVTKRLVRYWGVSRPDMAEGCVEGIHGETFLFYKWIWDTRRSHRTRLAALVADHGHLTVHHLRSTPSGAVVSEGFWLMVTIRASTPDDLGAVDALLARSYPKLLKPDYPPSVMVTVLPLISRAQPILLACGTYYVAELDGAIVGAGGWTRDRARTDKWHIRHVATDDRVLRRGVAKALILHSLEIASAQGIREMECWSTRTAEGFYHAMGFETLGPIDVDLAPGITFPSIRMRQISGVAVLQRKRADPEDRPCFVRNA